MASTHQRSGRRWILAGMVAASAAGYLVLHRLGRTSGSTPAERSRRLPGDELVNRPTLVTNHAAHLPAPPEDVWPWLTQLGWHRGWLVHATMGGPAAVHRQLAQR
jgi:hypothetical protein